jgi:hypothetical protein
MANIVQKHFQQQEKAKKRALPASADNVKRVAAAPRDAHSVEVDECMKDFMLMVNGLTKNEAVRAEKAPPATIIDLTCLATVAANAQTAANSSGSVSSRPNANLGINAPTVTNSSGSASSRLDAIFAQLDSARQSVIALQRQADELLPAVVDSARRKICARCAATMEEALNDTLYAKLCLQKHFHVEVNWMVVRADELSAGADVVTLMKCIVYYGPKELCNALSVRIYVDDRKNTMVELTLKTLLMQQSVVIEQRMPLTLEMLFGDSVWYPPQDAHTDAEFDFNSLENLIYTVPYVHSYIVRLCAFLPYVSFLIDADDEYRYIYAVRGGSTTLRPVAVHRLCRKCPSAEIQKHTKQCNECSAISVMSCTELVARTTEKACIMNLTNVAVLLLLEPQQQQFSVKFDEAQKPYFESAKDIRYCALNRVQRFLDTYKPLNGAQSARGSVSRADFGIEFCSSALQSDLDIRKTNILWADIVQYLPGVRRVELLQQ